MDNFYVSSNLPEPFRAADMIMAERYPSPKTVKEPKVVPMPTITPNRGASGPIKITEDWYEKEKAKKHKKREKEKKEYEIEMIQLLAKRDMLRSKLNDLNPAKKKDAKRIAAINIEIRNINADLRMMETQSGIHIDELDRGSKIGRFFGKLKQKGKKIVKKIKKFCRNNSELITGILSIALPTIIGFIFKSIFKSNS